MPTLEALSKSHHQLNLRHNTTAATAAPQPKPLLEWHKKLNPSLIQASAYGSIRQHPPVIQASSSFSPALQRRRICCCMLPYADESVRGAHRLPCSGEAWRPLGVPPAAVPDPCGPMAKVPNLRARAPGIPAAIERASSAAVSKSHTSAYISVRQRTSAYVSVRQRTSAYARQENPQPLRELRGPLSVMHVSSNQSMSAASKACFTN